jgi:hypothetical protein
MEEGHQLADVEMVVVLVIAVQERHQELVVRNTVAAADALVGDVVVAVVEILLHVHFDYDDDGVAVLVVALLSSWMVVDRHRNDVRVVVAE